MMRGAALWEKRHAMADTDKHHGMGLCFCVFRLVLYGGWAVLGCADHYGWNATLGYRGEGLFGPLLLMLLDGDHW